MITPIIVIWIYILKTRDFFTRLGNDYERGLGIFNLMMLCKLAPKWEGAHAESAVTVGSVR